MKMIEINNYYVTYFADMTQFKCANLKLDKIKFASQLALAISIS